MNEKDKADTEDAVYNALNRDKREASFKKINNYVWIFSLLVACIIGIMNNNNWVIAFISLFVIGIPLSLALRKMIGLR